MKGPTGDDPTRLDGAVATDHLELRGLVVEVERDPPTPGVVREVVHTLDHRLRIHLAAVEHVLFPLLADGHQDVLDRAGEDHARLRAELDALWERSREDRLRLPNDVDDLAPHRTDLAGPLRQVLEDHAAFEEQVLLPALRSGAGDRYRALGLRFSRLKDEGFTEPPPGADPRSGVPAREGSAHPRS